MLVFLQGLTKTISVRKSSIQVRKRRTVSHMIHWKRDTRVRCHPFKTDSRNMLRKMDSPKLQNAVSSRIMFGFFSEKNWTRLLLEYFTAVKFSEPTEQYLHTKTEISCKCPMTFRRKDKILNWSKIANPKLLFLFQQEEVQLKKKAHDNC